jgi:16S rRNA (guanine(1405)-N(7))-methyltransferase
MESDLLNVILRSKKYSGIYHQTIRRILAEEIPKYKKEKELIKAVKNRLHQLSCSFYDNKALQKGSYNEAAFFELLKHHSSTKERLMFYNDMFADIISVAGPVASILDIACGLNPIMFGMFLLNNKVFIKDYYAQDINSGILDLVERYFQSHKLPCAVQQSDLLVSVPGFQVDLALMLKVVPLFEQQKKDYYGILINSLNARYIAVSFPTRTMSGRNAGMTENYKNLFDLFIKGSVFNVVLEKIYQNELLYIISRNLKSI